MKETEMSPSGLLGKSGLLEFPLGTDRKFKYVPIWQNWRKAADVVPWDGTCVFCDEGTIAIKNGRSDPSYLDLVSEVNLFQLLPSDRVVIVGINHNTLAGNFWDSIWPLEFSE